MVTLVLYFGHNRRWDKPLTLQEALDMPEEFKPFVPDMRLNLFEIAFLSHEQVSLFRSDFRIVADYFVQKHETGDYNPSHDDMEHFKATLQLLGVMGDWRFEEVYNESVDKGEMRNMCDVLDRIENRGIERGRAEGMAEGKAEGAEEQARMTARNLRSMGLNPVDIARAVNRSLGVVQQWLSAEMA